MAKGKKLPGNVTNTPRPKTPIYKEERIYDPKKKKYITIRKIVGWR